MIAVRYYLVIQILSKIIRFHFSRALETSKNMMFLESVFICRDCSSQLLRGSLGDARIFPGVISIKYYVLGNRWRDITFFIFYCIAYWFPSM